MLLKWFRLDAALLFEAMCKSLKQSIILWQISYNNSKLYAYLIVYNVEPLLMSQTSHFFI
jgi:hypothetical protein